MQQAKNATMWLDEIGVKPEFLIHDRDRKLPEKFKDFWKDEDVKCIKIPPKSPKANSFYERVIWSIKHECLNHFMCFSLGQINRIMAQWRSHYNSRRPHRGVGKMNEVLDRDFEPQIVGPIRCRQRLGGLIKDYYREAA